MGVMRKSPLPFLPSIGAATLLLLGATAFSQTTIHVPAGQPTIQAGIDAAGNGDTVLVAPGTYAENINFHGKAITVTSGAKSFMDAGVASTVITGTGSGPIVVFKTNEPQAAILNGFTIQNGTATAVYFSGSSATLSNNVITKNSGCSVVITGANASPVITGNDISQTSSGTSCGVLVALAGENATNGDGINIIGAGNVEITGNTIEGNISAACGGGIFADSVATLVLSNNTIRNNYGACAAGVSVENIGNLSLIQNLIYANITQPSGAFGGVGAGIVAVLLSKVSLNPKLILINNTIFGNQDYGLNSSGYAAAGSQAYFSNSPGVTYAQSIIENNLFVSSNNEGSVYCDNTGPLTVFSHNDLETAAPIYPSNCTQNDSAAGNLAVDPEFIDPATNNFHTQPTSPVVAAGDINALLIPPADLDNKAREICGTIDMGVYEVRPRPATVVTSSNNPSVGGTTVTFTARVPGNCSVPTGTVTFLDGGNPIGTVALDANASASISTAALTVGSHNITVTYPGDFNFDSSTSGILVQVVTGYPTSTSLQVSPNPAKAFQPISFTAGVSSPFGTPTGTVTFLAGGSVIGTASLNSSGVASTTVSTLGAGTYSVTAVYGATTNFAASTSAPVIEVVVGSNTSTSLLASPNPVIFGQTETLATTVIVTQGGGVGSGLVTFLDGTQVLGAATLNASGVTSFNTSSLALGPHSITASYAGSINANASVSPPVNVVVIAIPTSVGLNATPNPASLGQSVVLTASVAGAGAVPGGTATFSDHGTVLGSGAVNASGLATFTTSSLSAGTHNITATLSAFGNYAGSISAPLAEVITNYDFSLVISPTSARMPSGDFEDLKVTVTPLNGFTGNIQLSCASLPEHAQCGFSSGGNVALAGSARTVTLTLNTSDVFGYGDKVGKLNHPETPRPSRTLPILAGMLLPALLLPRLRFWPKYRLLVLFAGAGLLLGAQGCSGKLPGKTAPGNYLVTVTGSSSTVSHTVDMLLVVTQ